MALSPGQTIVDVLDLAEEAIWAVALTVARLLHAALPSEEQRPGPPQLTVVRTPAPGSISATMAAAMRRA